MAHHRCSKCREEVGIRHKYHGYLFCDACLVRLLYRSPVRGWGGFADIFGFVSRAWRWLRDATINLFGQPAPAAARKTYNAKTRARMASAQWKARSVPTNPAAVSPQMR